VSGTAGQESSGEDGRTDALAAIAGGLAHDLSAIRSQLPADLWLLRGESLRVYRLLLEFCLDARAALTAGPAPAGGPGGELTLTAWNES